jgi:hypothetical protein
MTTARIRYVNPHSSGGNGTTDALSGANAAYASLNAALTAERGDLVAADVWLEIICATNGNADTARIIEVAANWTTDATHYVHIKAAEGHRAGTSWNTAKYRIDGAFAFVSAFSSSIPYLRVEGLQARNTSTSAGSNGFRFTSATLAADVRAVGLLTRGNQSYGFGFEGGTYTVRNCVSIGNGGDGIIFDYGAPGCVATVDNCTSVANTGFGIVVGSSSNNNDLTNCYAGGNTGADYGFVGGGNSLTTCYSEDGSQSTATAAYATGSGARFTNVTSGSEDVAIQAGSALIGAGTDLSGSFTTDITGKTRSVPWDIGAFEYVETALPRIPYRHYIPLLVR